MNSPIKIRNKVFKFKKYALLYFKKMLSSYEIDECLNQEDKSDVIALAEENGDRKPHNTFTAACRTTIRGDLRNVKQQPHGPVFSKSVLVEKLSEKMSLKARCYIHNVM